MMKRSPTKDLVKSRQQVTSSNLATLNALNRQLKRDYLRGTESTRDRSKSPTKAVRGQHSPTRSRDFARERDRRNNRGDVFSNTGSRRSISPVSMDGMHHDGRISEYNQEYVPWELQERTRVSKQQEYTPIPYSGENYDRNQWKTQQRIEDERMARQAVQFREHSPTAAGVRYNKHDTAPVFYAWNPEDDHIHGGYEAEDPEGEAGGIQHEHQAENNNQVSEYNLKYKWLPFEERQAVRRSQADTLALFGDTDGALAAKGRIQSESRHRYSPLQIQRDEPQPTAAGRANLTTARPPHHFAWPIDQLNDRRHEVQSRDGGRDSESHSKYVPLPLQENTMPRGNKSADSLALFKTGPVDSPRTYQTEAGRQFVEKGSQLPSTTDVPLAGVTYAQRDNAPHQFAWPIEQVKDKRKEVSRGRDLDSEYHASYQPQSGLPETPLPPAPPVRNADMDSEYHSQFVPKTATEKSIPHRNVTDHVAMLTLTDSSQPFDGDAFKSEASLKFVPQTHAVDQSNVPVAGVTHGSPTKPPNHFAWPIQQVNDSRREPTRTGHDGRVSEYATKFVPVTVQLEVAQREPHHHAPDSLSLFKTGPIGSPRTAEAIYHSETAEKFKPVQEDSVMMGRSDRHVEGHSSSNVPVNFAWPIQEVPNPKREMSQIRDRTIDGRDSEYHSTFMPLPMPPPATRQAHHATDQLALFHTGPLLEDPVHSDQAPLRMYESETERKFVDPSLEFSNSRAFQESLPIAGVSSGSHPTIPSNFAWLANVKSGGSAKKQHQFPADDRETEYTSKYLPPPEVQVTKAAHPPEQLSLFEETISQQPPQPATTEMADRYVHPEDDAAGAHHFYNDVTNPHAQSSSHPLGHANLRSSAPLGQSISGTADLGVTAGISTRKSIRPPTMFAWNRLSSGDEQTAENSQEFVDSLNPPPPPPSSKEYAAGMPSLPPPPPSHLDRTSPQVIPRRFQSNPAFSASSGRPIDTDHNISRTSRELWQTEYESKFGGVVDAERQARAPNPVPPSDGSSTAPHPPPPPADDVHTHKKKKHFGVVEQGDGFYRFLPISQDQQHGGDNISSGSSSGVSHRPAALGSHASATINSAEQATFADSLDGSLQQRGVQTKPTCGVSSPRSSYSEPTISAALKSKVPTNAAAATAERHKVKKFPLRACYSLRATSNLSPPRPSQQQNGQKKATTSSSRAAATDGSNTNNAYVATLPDADMMDNTIEDSENNSSRANISTSAQQLLAANENKPEESYVTNHKKWLQQQREHYNQMRQRHAAEQEREEAGEQQPQQEQEPNASSSAFEAPSSRSRRHFATEHRDNYDWQNRDWQSATEARVALNQRHKHHDLLMSGHVDSSKSAQPQREPLPQRQSAPRAPIPSTEYDREYSKEGHPSQKNYLRMQQLAHGKQAFGRSTGKHQPLWVHGSERPAHIEGVFRSQAPQNNVTLPPPPPPPRPETAPRSNAGGNRPTSSLQLDTSKARYEGDSTATVAPLTADFTIATFNSEPSPADRQPNVNTTTSAPTYDDAGSSITSVAAHTQTTLDSASTANRRGVGAGGANARSKVAAVGFASPVTGAKQASTSELGTASKTAQAAAAVGVKVPESRVNGHPPNCSCSLCFKRVGVEAPAPRNNSASITVSPRRHRNMELVDSASSARMAVHQGLRDYVDTVHKTRAQSAPTRRARGFGDTAHDSGVTWYKARAKPEDTNVILSYKRFPNESDAQIGRWSTETRSSFKWKSGRRAD